MKNYKLFLVLFGIICLYSYLFIYPIWTRVLFYSDDSTSSYFYGDYFFADTILNHNIFFPYWNPFDAFGTSTNPYRIFSSFHNPISFFFLHFVKLFVSNFQTFYVVIFNNLGLKYGIFGFGCFLLFREIFNKNFIAVSLSLISIIFSSLSYFLIHNATFVNSFIWLPLIFLFTIKLFNSGKGFYFIPLTLVLSMDIFQLGRDFPPNCVTVSIFFVSTIISLRQPRLLFAKKMFSLRANYRYIIPSIFLLGSVCLFILMEAHEFGQYVKYQCAGTGSSRENIFKALSYDKLFCLPLYNWFFGLLSVMPAVTQSMSFFHIFLKTYYIPIVMIPFVPLGVLLRDNNTKTINEINTVNTKRLFVIFTALISTFALGPKLSFIYYFVFKYFPSICSYEYVYVYQYYAILGFITLGGFGIYNYFETKNTIRKYSAYSIALVAVLGLYILHLFLSINRVKLDNFQIVQFLHVQSRAEWISMMIKEAVFVIILLSLYFILLSFWTFTDVKIRRYFVFPLILLLFFEVTVVNKAWLYFINPGTAHSMVHWSEKDVNPFLSSKINYIFDLGRTRNRSNLQQLHQYPWPENNILKAFNDYKGDYATKVFYYFDTQLNNQKVKDVLLGVDFQRLFLARNAILIKDNSAAINILNQFDENQVKNLVILHEDISAIPDRFKKLIITNNNIQSYSNLSPSCASIPKKNMIILNNGDFVYEKFIADHNLDIYEINLENFHIPSYLSTYYMHTTSKFINLYRGDNRTWMNPTWNNFWDYPNLWQYNLKKNILEVSVPHGCKPTYEYFLEYNEILPGIEIKGFNPNELELKVNSNGDKLLFYSDLFDGKHRAFINGVEIPVYRANVAFKAIFIPCGENNIRIIYDPRRLRILLYLIYPSFIIFTVVTVLHSYINFRKQKTIWRR